MDTFVFGFHPLRELLRHRPRDVAQVWVSAAPGKRRREIEALCGRLGIQVESATSAELSARSEGQAHNGFAAETVAAGAGLATGRDANLVLLAEDIQDPRNLGALLRVCEGAGVGKVLLRDRGSAPLSAAAIKTSAGAAEWLDLERVTNTTREIERLREQGFWVYGADADGEPPWELDLTGPVALVVGGEADGLRRLTRDSCDGLVGLPMRGRVASLNLATAAAALLYEAVRQRSPEASPK
ncbi:MAG: 23S rRNA (guanosine(2251)-2'-O)-methyltransferase RlmB [Acidobacteriota bacterium]